MYCGYYRQWHKWTNARSLRSQMPDEKSVMPHMDIFLIWVSTCDSFSALTLLPGCWEGLQMFSSGTRGGSKSFSTWPFKQRFWWCYWYCQFVISPRKKPNPPTLKENAWPAQKIGRLSENKHSTSVCTKQTYTSDVLVQQSPCFSHVHCIKHRRWVLYTSVGTSIECCTEGSTAEASRKWGMGWRFQADWSIW